VFERTLSAFFTYNQAADNDLIISDVGAKYSSVISLLTQFFRKGVNGLIPYPSKDASDEDRDFYLDLDTRLKQIDNMSQILGVVETILAEDPRWPKKYPYLHESAKCRTTARRIHYVWFRPDDDEYNMIYHREA